MRGSKHKSKMLNSSETRMACRMNASLNLRSVSFPQFFHYSVGNPITDLDQQQASQGICAPL